jgi:nucleoside-diphosphate-sugar epimerase
MTSIEKIKMNKANPTTLIVGGVNFLGQELVESLIDQKGFVIMLDDINKGNIEYVRKYLDSDLFLFTDNSTLGELKDELSRIDYIIYLTDLVSASNTEIESEEFLKRSNLLSETLKLSLHFKSKFVLCTSLPVFENSSVTTSKKSKSIHDYDVTELQRYSESLTKEYIKKASLNARIVRLGEVIGYGMEIKNTDSNFVRLCKLALSAKPLTIYGEGLELRSYVNVKDASLGILKSLFEDKTKDKIYSLCYPQNITALSLAYKIAEVEPKAGHIVFKEGDNTEGVFTEKSEDNLSEIGWEAKIPLERSIAQVVSYINDVYTKKVEIHEEKVVDSSKKKFIDNVSKLGRSRSRDSKIHLSDEKLRTKLSSSKEVNFDRNSNSYKVKHFLKTLTFSKLINYLIIIVLCFILYFGILSPVLRNAKAIYELNNISKLETFNDSDISKAKISVSGILTDVNNFKGVYDLFYLKDLYTNLNNSFSIDNEYLNFISTNDSEISKLETFFVGRKTIKDFKLLKVDIDRLNTQKELTKKTNLELLDSINSSIVSKIENSKIKPVSSYLSFISKNHAFDQNKNILLMGQKDGVVKYFNIYSFRDNQLVLVTSSEKVSLDLLTPEIKASVLNISKNKLTEDVKNTEKNKIKASMSTISKVSLDEVEVFDTGEIYSLIGSGTVAYKDKDVDSVDMETLLKTDQSQEIFSTIVNDYLKRDVELSKLGSYLGLLEGVTN